MVSQASEKFKLAPIGVSDLPDVQAISIPDKISFNIEQPLTDKTNENSCVLTYYELGLEDCAKTKLTNEIVMEFLNEPFFNSLRT